MKVIIAKTAGFCFGVSRAIKMVEDSLNKDNYKKIYSLGPIIHNKQVVEEFQEKGVNVIEDIDQVEHNNVLIIRAHGVSPSIYDQIRVKNAEIVDTTCPFVKKIHMKVSEYSYAGYKIIIVGDEKHPEVIGIKGWDENAVVIGNDEEAQNLDISGKVCVVAQTTLSKEKWDNICENLKQNIEECEVFNTICNATSERQKEAKEIADKVEVMFVIGDPNSSNTRKLYEISKKYCENTFLIENASQVDLTILENKNIVGITAGASTPDRIIKEVIDKMSEINKTNEEEMSFEELFEKSMRTITDGEVLKGKVISVTNKEIFVDLGYKADGIIPLNEFSDDPEEKHTEMYKAGDEIEVYVLRVNDGEGNVLLSRKRIGYSKGWEKIQDAFEKGTFIKCIVSDVVNGGVIALANGIRIFVPASLISDRRVGDLNEFRKKVITLKIVDFNRQKKKVVGSQRAVLQQQREGAKKNLLKNIEVGQTIKGVVKRLADFGVFVDIGGLDGLVHISELSWNRIKHPSEIVKEGQEVEVKVLGIDKEKEKISLGYRKTIDDPWQGGIDKYEVGNLIKGKVVNLMPFGAFVEIESGLTGLVHISQISNKRILKPQEALTIGQEVEAKITEINKENQKISLSIKETLPILVDEKAEKKEEGHEIEKVPSEHKEELKLTLGDVIKKEEEKVVQTEEKKEGINK